MCFDHIYSLSFCSQTMNVVFWFAFCFRFILFFYFSKILFWTPVPYYTLLFVSCILHLSFSISCLAVWRESFLWNLPFLKNNSNISSPITLRAVLKTERNEVENMSCRIEVLCRKTFSSSVSVTVSSPFHILLPRCHLWKNMNVPSSTSSVFS